MTSISFDKAKLLMARLKRKPTDVVGLDIAHSGVKAVRIKKVDGLLSLQGADILSPVILPKKSDETPGPIAPIVLPKKLAGRYGCLAVPGANAVVKLLSFPGHLDQLSGEIESKIVEGIAVEAPDKYRIGYKLVTEGRGKTESRILAVAVPDVEARSACMLLPSGLPAPLSVEVSGLAAMTAFLQGPGASKADDATGMIEFGANISFFAIFYKGIPVLIRKFDIGSASILARVQESLGIDRATAEGILSDGSFDISQPMSEVLDGFVKQIVVSRDFVERRENCRVGKVFASGGATGSRDWLTEMKSALGYDLNTWNPFDGLRVEQDAVPDRLKGQEGRFAAAVGACLATLAEEEQ